MSAAGAWAAHIAARATCQSPASGDPLQHAIPAPPSPRPLPVTRGNAHSPLLAIQPAVNLAPPLHGRDSACFGVHQEQGSVRELTCIIAHFGCSVQPRARSRANCQTPAWLSCRVAEPMACAWAKLTPVLEGTPTVLWTTSNSSGSASRRRPRRAGLARGRRRGCFCGATSFCAGEIPAQICRFSQVGRSQHAKAMHHAGGKSY